MYFFIDTHQIYTLPVPADCTGSVILDLVDDFIVITGVSLTLPDRIFIGRINFDKLEDPVNWKCLTIGNELTEGFKLSSDKLSFTASDECEYEVC